MATGYVLYNKNAGKKEDSGEVKRLSEIFRDELKFLDVKEIDHKQLIAGMEKDDFIVVSGGDGTLNNFVNRTEGVAYPGEILYFPNGSGNDFARDLGYQKGSNPFPVSEYIKKLPCVVVDGKKYRFINGVGYGIDGYCCQMGDELKKTGKQEINYTGIAIKGLLFHYKPTNAKVTVDGVTKEYKKVWLAPTMFGHYYGGGMMPTPKQDRKDDTVSVMVYYGKGKLKSLIVFPSLFKGEHVKHTEMIDVRCGKEITVEFDRPTPLQIDGETILGVTSYTAYCPSKADAMYAEDKAAAV